MELTCTDATQLARQWQQDTHHIGDSASVLRALLGMELAAIWMPRIGRCHNVKVNVRNAISNLAAALLVRFRGGGFRNVTGELAEKGQSMTEFLSRALTPVILIYVVSAMLALGLTQTVNGILAPLRNIRITILAVVASYVILPLVAALTARVFGLDDGLRFGLVLIAMAGGAEIGPLLTTNSNANVRLSGGILVLSIAITIIYLPLMLGVFLPEVHFDVKHLLLKLFLTIVAPLLLGLFIRSRSEKTAHTAAHYLHLNSRIFVILLTVVVVLLYYQQIFALRGTYAILAALVSVVGGFALGYVLGWPDRGTRLAMGYMHGARNASVAVMVASDVFRDQPNVMLMIATVVMLILVILIPTSYLCRIKPGPA